MSDNVVHYNSRAWDRQVASNNEWTVPVSKEEVEAARRGEWQVVLTPKIPVPREWFGELTDQKVLCLASGGGQQVPILAAAGAKVTCLDNSEKQLEQDRQVAERDGLDLRLCQGDMAKLDMFEPEEFDLIFNPCSICFSPEPRQVWKECARVLKRGGILMTGVTNPALYLFDDAKMQAGTLEVAYTIPYSDETDLPEDQKAAFVESGEPFAFGHSLDDLLGGLTDAGFAIDRIFEDGFGDGDYSFIDRHIRCFLAVRARKLSD